MISLLALAAIVGTGRADVGRKNGSGSPETDSWRMAAVASHYKMSGWRLLDVRRIWAVEGWPAGSPDLRHNAFTDLAWFKDAWYCVFRVAPDHGQRGRIRVIRSRDGAGWESVFFYEAPVAGTDVRDSKLAVTPGGRLMISGSERYVHEPARTKFAADGLERGTMSWLSADGLTWEGPFRSTTAANTWIWSSPVWRAGTGYGVAYCGKHPGGAIYTTADGREWTLLADDVFPPGAQRGNEASLLFAPDGTGRMLLRDGPGWKSFLGPARPPYTTWTWKAVGPTLGGPKLVMLPDGRLIAAGRASGQVEGFHDSRTALFEVDPDAGTMHRILELPSMGDNGYPGIVERNGELWISYYSVHEDPNPEGRDSWNQRSSIYLARVRIGGPRFTHPR